MTLSKLKQEGREEFDQKFPNEVSGYIDKYGKNVRLFMPAVDVDNIIIFLTAQIEKAYLSALADVKKWTKGRNVTKDSLREVINKLKEQI